MYIHTYIHIQGLVDFQVEIGQHANTISWASKLCSHLNTLDWLDLGGTATTNL